MLFFALWCLRTPWLACRKQVILGSWPVITKLVVPGSWPVFTKQVVDHAVQIEFCTVCTKELVCTLYVLFLKFISQGSA